MVKVFSPLHEGFYIHRSHTLTYTLTPKNTHTLTQSLTHKHFCASSCITTNNDRSRGMFSGGRQLLFW